MFVTTPEYSTEPTTLLIVVPPERITRGAAQCRGDCVLCVESKSSDFRGSDISRKVELKVEITDLVVICGVVHVKID